MAKKIGIYGIAGVYNLGCEAIIRGTYENFRSIYPNSEWIYFSPNAKEDCKVLNDLPIEVRETKKNFVFMKKCFNKLFDIFNIGYQIPYDDYNEIIRNVDIIISVGGDIYTIPSYLREKEKYAYKNRLVDFGEKAIKKGKRIVIYGASIGPFGNYEKAVNYFKNHFKKVDMIIVREKNTEEYLNNIGLNNVALLPDPAFALRKNYLYDANSETIGINLSGLSILETYGSMSIDNIKSMAAVVESIIEKTGFNIRFYPHVFAPYDIDNDLVIQKKIIEYVDSSFKDKVSISTCKSFLEVKKDLSNCSILIAARMHCAINAISEGIPTILLSYSNKSKGMCEFVYDDQKWVYDIKKINDKKLLFLIEEMIKNRKILSANIVNNLNIKLNNENYCDVYSRLIEIYDSI